MIGFVGDNTNKGEILIGFVGDNTNKGEILSEPGFTRFMDLWMHGGNLCLAD